MQVGGEAATLLVWSPDYDGNGKALVRLADGPEPIVGGSRSSDRKSVFLDPTVFLDPIRLESGIRQLCYLFGIPR